MSYCVIIYIRLYQFNFSILQRLCPYMTPFPPTLVLFYCHKLHLCTLYAHQHRFIIIATCSCLLNEARGKNSYKQNIHLYSFYIYLYGPFWVNFCVWYEEGAQLHSFMNAAFLLWSSYAVFPASFVARTTPSPLNCLGTLVENQLTVNVRSVSRPSIRFHQPVTCPDARIALSCLL